MNEKPLHILIIASWYKSSENPTSGSFIEEQARMLQNKGHKVTIIHPYLKGTFLGTLKNRITEIKQENDEGIQIIKIGVSPFLPKFRKLSYIKLYHQTEKIINLYILEKGIPHLIHSHALFMGGVIGKYLSKKLKIPQFHTEHTSGLIFQLEQYTKSDIHLLKEVYSHCKKVFFVSEFAKNKITQAFELKNENFAIIHNVVDSMFFNSIPQTINSPSKFLVVGNIIPRKNHVLLINAWKVYSSVHTDSTLTIAGEGENLLELKSLCEDLNVDDSINWLGGQNRNEVKQLINEHHVVLSTSKLETFGLTVAEAVASGKPVVVTDSGGVRDIINTFNGIITHQSVEAFSMELSNMKKDFDKYDSFKIQEDAKLKFSEDIIYSLLEENYRNFLNE